MGNIWLLTLQIVMLAFVISTATAALIWLTRVVLKKLARKDKGAKK